MSALDRARDWSIAPPPGPPSSGWSAPPRPDDPPRPRHSKRPPRPSPSHPAGPSTTRGDEENRPPSQATLPSPTDDRPSAAAGVPRDAIQPAAPLARGATTSPAAAADGAAARTRAAASSPAAPLARGATTSPAAAPDVAAALPRDLPAALTSAAVLGRPGEVEPIAAALALVLRRETRAKAAAVALVGVEPPVVEGASSVAAARRLAARLEVHGHEPQVRGRIAWVELDAEDPQFAAVARRVTMVGAPAVLAVAAARTAAVDEALNEQDLLILVTTDPEGALAQLAVAGLTDVPVLTARPLRRGPGRSLASAGIRAARPLRQLLLMPRPEVAR
jgi:hypothetical protein